MTAIRQVMTVDELTRLDWNLVPALDVLLNERNVSRAARRLGMSQSAASGALARLRRHFNDDLLIREGATYVLTPKAQVLVPQVREVVRVTTGMLTTAQGFEAHDSTREFVLAASEYGQTMLGAPLIRRLAAAAPRARLTFRGMNPKTALTDWLSVVDGWIGPRYVLADTPCTGMRVDEWVCVAWRGSHLVPETLELDDAARLRWILPTVAQDRDAPWRKRLLNYGIDLNIAVTTENFSAVPFMVRGTDTVGIVQQSLAQELADAADVRILACPWTMPPLTFTFWWDAAREHDPAHQWLREQIEHCMDDVSAGAVDLTTDLGTEVSATGAPKAGATAAPVDGAKRRNETAT